MMGRGRTHHHVAKQKSEDQSRRPVVAMDYFFMRMGTAPNVQAISEESITCIAVKEDRHQNIMSSVALKKGLEEPWTIERVVRFIVLHGYREITLKSDTEPAFVAFRNRVAAMCKAEVTTEDAVKGGKESNGLVENAMMLLRGIIRTVKCHIESRMQEPVNDDSLVMPRLWSTPGVFCPGVKKVVTGRHHLRDFTARGRHKNSSRSERRCWQERSPHILRTSDANTEFGLECETTVQSVSSGMYSELV